MQNQNTIPESIDVPTQYCVLMYNLINLVAKRGAVNSDEFLLVGELHNYLKKKIEMIQSQSRPQPQSQAQPQP